MTAYRFPMAISQFAASTAPEAPIERHDGHHAARLVHLHLELGGGSGPRHFCRVMVHV